MSVKLIRTGLLRYAWVLIPLAFMLVNGVRGIDFGYHWDEPFMVNSARASITTREWLPDTYNYPSSAYWLVVAAAAPDILADNDAPSVDNYLLQARPFFLLVTSLALVVVYVLVLHITRWLLPDAAPWWSKFPALLAASVLALSWEFGYHTRWIAPDGLVAFNATLTILFGVSALAHPGQRRWLWLTAAAAGLTLGSKYNAALIGIVVLLAVYFVWRMQAERTYGLLLRWLVIADGISAVAFLLTTPGIVLDTAGFVRDVEYELTHYSEQGHFNHTVSAGVEHLWLNLRYLVLVAFSPYPVIAVLLVAFVPLGVAALWRYSAQMAVLFLSFPVIYLLFMSSQRVMIVRNLLVFLPVLAVLLGLGIVAVMRTLQRQSRRWLVLQFAFALVLAASLAANAVWIIEATRTIENRHDQAAFTRQAAAYIQDKEAIFCLSGGVYFRFQQADYPVPPGVFLPDAAPIDYVMYVTSEVNPLAVQANDYALTETWFGPYEVNYNYYPSWEGDERIVVMRADKFKAANLDISNCNGVRDQ